MGVHQEERTCQLLRTSHQDPPRANIQGPFLRPNLEQLLANPTALIAKTQGLGGGGCHS